MGGGQHLLYCMIYNSSKGLKHVSLSRNPHPQSVHFRAQTIQEHGFKVVSDEQRGEFRYVQAVKTSA